MWLYRVCACMPPFLLRRNRERDTSCVQCQEKKPLCFSSSSCVRVFLGIPNNHSLTITSVASERVLLHTRRLWTISARWSTSTRPCVDSKWTYTVKYSIVRSSSGYCRPHSSFVSRWGLGVEHYLLEVHRNGLSWDKCEKKKMGDSEWNLSKKIMLLRI